MNMFTSSMRVSLLQTMPEWTPTRNWTARRNLWTTIECRRPARWILDVQQYLWGTRERGWRWSKAGRWIISFRWCWRWWGGSRGNLLLLLFLGGGKGGEVEYVWDVHTFAMYCDRIIMVMQEFFNHSSILNEMLKTFFFLDSHSHHHMDRIPFGQAPQAEDNHGSFEQSMSSLFRHMLGIGNNPPRYRWLSAPESLLTSFLVKMFENILQR